MGEFRLPDRGPFLVSLLDARTAHLQFIPCHDTSTCGVCRRPYRKHGRPPVAVQCERCGLEFDGRCYLGRVASPQERAWFKRPTDGELGHPIFLCHGCRS